MNYILADNQDLTRYALRSFLSMDKANTIQIASDKDSLMQLLTDCEQSIILLDYTMFDYTDEEQLFEVSKRFVQSQWIIICDELPSDSLRKIVNSSHRFSIVYKDCPMPEIIEAINATKTGRRYICQRAVDLFLALQQEKVEAPNLLTATEIEIVKSIARGLTTKDIARERISSIHTINTHRKNIFHKLGINTSYELIRYAIRSGLFDASEYYI